MKKRMKKTIAVLLAAVIILTTLAIAPFTASAATTAPELESTRLAVLADAQGMLNQENADAYLDVYLNSNPDRAQVIKAFGAIQPTKAVTSRTSITGTTYQESTNYFWFFPSTADLSSLKIWFKTGTTVTIGGTQIESGVPTDVFADLNEGGKSQNFTIKINNTSYTTTVVKSGDVGTIYINTESGSLKTINSAALSNGSANTSVYETGLIMVIRPDGTVDYSGALAKMSGRGNGTWTTSGVKNPYSIKLASSASLLGMSSGKKWNLLASTGTGQDDTLVRNQMAYDFADYIGVKYQPHCKPVDLYVNQEYLGSYQLSEKVEIKSNRVNLDSDAYENLELANGTFDEAAQAIIPADLTGTAVTSYNPDTSTSHHNMLGHNVGAKKYSPSLQEPSDYTGGYIYELEISNRWVEENAGFCAYNRQGWVVKSADYMSTNMINYSYDLLYALGSAVYNNGTVPSTSKTTNCSSLTEAKSNLSINSKYFGYKSITNPAPAQQYWGKSWSELLDADSAVRYYWTQEFFKNMDASTSSTYFYKNSDPTDTKLYAGPVWDMDNSMGDCGDSTRWNISLTSTDKFYVKNGRIYRWRCNDSTKTYSSDNYAPLTFYAALAHCSDFWSMAEKYYYLYISPAADILLGKSEDPNGVLHSISYYVNTITKSAKMDALRFGSTYTPSSVISTAENWVSGRQKWINEQIPQTDISSFSTGTIIPQTYTGQPIEPKTTVSAFIQGTGNINLTEGTDFVMTYRDNVNAGTATAVINGVGVYKGTIEKTFTINPANLNVNHTLTIDSDAYVGTELKATLTNRSGDEITSSVTYQWLRNNQPIENATDSTYVLTDDDKGAQIKCTATGDNVNLTDSVTSNICNVASGDRPVGYTRTIASWNYDYTLDSTALVNGDETGESFYYIATGGENQATSKLIASVNATDSAKLKWSNTDLYTNDSTSVAKDQNPIMGTSKTDKLAWGQYPYAEAVISTAGYENIKFSAKLGGTNKAPRDWKLQYSLDGVNYTDIEGATYSIPSNKTMHPAFTDVALPEACVNQLQVYIRMVVTADAAINGTDRIVGITSGDIALNNILVTGSSLSVVTSLYAPTIEAENNDVIFSDNSVSILDNNGGADVFYSVNGGEPQLYTGAVMPFVKTDAAGTTATISAYSKFEDVQSDTTTVTLVYGGTNINSFSYSTYSTKVTAGAVQSTGGVYGESGRMTAYTDGSTQYVPLWNEKNGSFSVSPDDGQYWSAQSGFTYKVTTAGYEDITFSCKAHTTAQGPKSVTLQYSLNGDDFINVRSNVELSVSSDLEQIMITAPLPAACNDRTVLYIRLATTEDSTKGSDTVPATTLHNNASKGNLYVNDVIIAGNDNGEYKMPYTNKSTNYFGNSGTVKFVSPDGVPMQFIVKDGSDNIVLSGTYPEAGIQLSSVQGFDRTKQEPYTILIQAIEDEDVSKTNAITYYYKGASVVEFAYASDTEFEAANGTGATTATKTAGARAGSISMSPNGTDLIPLSFDSDYGIKVTKTTSNYYYATKNLDKPKNNGYWLIETSTLGFHNLTLNVEQLSSSKGPRDWGVAYSTNGTSFTYIANSNSRAIEGKKAVETYGNLPLPSACDDQETLYLKIFINGGEAVNGTELELLQADAKGNTGIKSLEITGIPLPKTISVNVVLPQGKNGTVPATNISGAEIYVNGTYAATTDSNGSANIQVATNAKTNVTVKYGTSERTLTVKATDDTTNETIVFQVLDANNDGYVNAKDFAIVRSNNDYSTYRQYFQQFINQTAEEAYN